MRYTLTVPFVAAKGRPRAGNGRIYTPEKTRQAEDDIGKRWIAQHGGRLLFAKGIPIRATVDVFLQRPATRPRPVPLTFAPKLPDADNVLKLLDALQGIAFFNDNQITTARVRKRWAECEAHMVITLEEDYIDILRMDRPPLILEEEA